MRVTDPGRARRGAAPGPDAGGPCLHPLGSSAWRAGWCTEEQVCTADATGVRTLGVLSCPPHLGPRTQRHRPETGQLAWGGGGWLAGCHGNQLFHSSSAGGEQGPGPPYLTPFQPGQRLWAHGSAHPLEGQAPEPRRGPQASSPTASPGQGLWDVGAPMRWGPQMGVTAPFPWGRVALVETPLPQTHRVSSTDAAPHRRGYIAGLIYPPIGLWVSGSPRPEFHNWKPGRVLRH